MPKPLKQTTLSPSRVIRRRARTFYLASLFFPYATRRDVHVVYAYFRTIDDLVDELRTGQCPDDAVRDLHAWEQEILGGGRREWSLMSSLESIIERHNIPRDYLSMVIEGARFDLTLGCVETLEELRHYSLLVAGSVGMVMAHVLGARHDEAIAAARDLGTAMQLTNVLRDVGEDFRRGRVYLPREDLVRRGCDPSRLSSADVLPGVREVMEMLAAEARRLYATGMAGIYYLPRSCQFGVYLSAVLYARILDKIEHNHFDVFTRRAHVGTAEKWGAILPAYVAHKRVRAL